MAKFKLIASRFDLANLGEKMKMPNFWYSIYADEQGNGVMLLDEAPSNDLLKACNVRCEPVKEETPSSATN